MERATRYTGAEVTLAGAVERAAATLADIRDLARARGAECLVVLVPDETQADAALQAEVSRAWARMPESIDFARPSRLMAAALGKRQDETIDLLPAFTPAGREVRLYKPRDTHWNRAGNRLVAEEIEPMVKEALRRRGSGR